MENLNDSPESREVDEYEEFEEKYNNPEFGQYTQTRFGKKYFPTPLVNNAKNKNAISFVDTASLPRISDSIYREIEHLPDYDYINSLAFEMLIRTTEYYKIDRDNNLSYEEKSKAFDELGVNLSEIHSYNLRKVTKYYNQNHKKDLLVYSYCDLRISDINNGLDKVIKYYLNKGLIYIIVRHKQTVNGITLNIEYKVDKNITYNKIKKTPSKYHIPVKFDYKNYQSETKFSAIDENIPLVTLEDDFLEYIRTDIPNLTKGKIEFTYSRPLVRFKESSIMTVPLNLELSKKALIDIVTKIKDEYDNGILKTPMNYLYNKNYILEEWKKDATFKVSKKAISEAFFVYDLYKAIDLAFEIKKRELELLKQKEIENFEVKVKKNIESMIKKTDEAIKYLKHTTLTQKQQKKSLQSYQKDKKLYIRKRNQEKEITIKEIKKKFKEQMNVYHTETVVIELVYDHYISAYMCKQYLKFMRKYINNSKYKKLIMGVAKN